MTNILINAGLSLLVGLSLIVVRSWLNRSREAAEEIKAENRELSGRLQNLSAELAEHKLKVAERYMTSDAFLLATADLKGDIRALRDKDIAELRTLILKSLGGE